MYFSPRDTCIQILHQLHMEMGLLSSPMGMFTSANRIFFNKASALLLTMVKNSCLRSGLWEHTSRSGAPVSSSTFLHPMDPTPCLHPPTTARQQDAEVDWKCPAIKNDNFCIFVMRSYHALLHLPCAAGSQLCLPTPSPQSQPPHKAGKQKPPFTQATP